MILEDKMTASHSLSLPPAGGEVGRGLFCVVIADDITGAAEMAGIAHRFGYETKVLIGEFLPDEAEVLVVDANTRSLSTIEANETIRQIMKALKSLDYQFIFKKTDSVLRGHIAAEIDTIIENSSYSEVVFAPANPSLGRTIEQGIYYVNGTPLAETDFANDPEFPAKSSKVSEVVRFKNPSHIPDVYSLESFSEIVVQLNSDILPAGGSDFFTAILSTFSKTDFRPENEDEMREKSIMVLGSLSQYSREFLSQQINGGAEFMPVPTNLITEEIDNEKSKWIETAKIALENQNRILIKLDGMVSPTVSPKEVAQRFSTFILKLINELNCPLHLLIEGGSTAASFFSAAEITTFEVLKEHQRGIVSLKSNQSPNLVFTIKPGSYTWSEDIQYPESRIKYPITNVQ